MSFNSLLNKTCDIEYCQRACDALGQSIATWESLHCALACRFRTRSVSERRYGSPAYQEAQAALYLRAFSYSCALSDMRVNFEDKVYDIVGKINMGGADKYFCLYLRRCE